MAIIWPFSIYEDLAILKLLMAKFGLFVFLGLATLSKWVFFREFQKVLLFTGNWKIDWHKCSKKVLRWFERKKNYYWNFINRIFWVVIKMSRIFLTFFEGILSYSIEFNSKFDSFFCSIFSCYKIFCSFVTRSFNLS